MDELEKDSDLAIVLNIIEGTGLNFKKQSVIIEASLAGNVLETDVLFPGDLTTQCDCNLIWAADKSSVKQMRDENIPIKLTCFSINSYNTRETIGFILVQMRTIKYTFGRKNAQVKPRWHKFLGVDSHWKQQKPELLLSVSLFERDDYKNMSDETKQSDELQIDDTFKKSVEEQGNMLSADDGLFIQVLREGLIQIGDSESDNHQFNVIIHLKYAEGLQNLLSTRVPTTKPFKLKYLLFGNASQIDLPLSADNNQCTIDEKITIKFRSSLKMLKKYFLTKFCIFAELLYDDILLGNLRIKFGESMLPLPDSIEDFVTIYNTKRNTFLLEDYTVIYPLKPVAASESKIHYIFGVKYVKKKKYSVPTPSEPHKKLPSRIDNRAPIMDVDHQEMEHKAGGDNNLQDGFESKKCREVSSPMDISPRRSTRPNSAQQKSNAELTKNIPRTFSYTLVFIDCKFDRRPLAGIWQISLSHLEADNPLAVRNFEMPEATSELVNLKNLDLSLCFTTEEGHLVDIINSRPCLLTLKGPKGFRAIAELDNENILSQEKTTGIIVFENDQDEQSAMAHVFVELKDLGLNFNNRDKYIISRKKSFPTPKLDEDLAYKAIEELEEWKSNQKEQFISELKRREINHLAHLSNEWQRRRSDEEAKLACKLEHCELLTKSLEEAYAGIKERCEMGEASEKYWSKTKEDADKINEHKIQKLQDRIKELERESVHLLKKEEITRMEIDMRAKILVEENVKLKERQSELESLVQNSLPKEQVAGLYSELAVLSEKSEREYNSKLFFKKQWTKAIRELYYRKMETISGIRDPLSQRDDVFEIIDSARTDLNIEREELQEIKNILARYNYK